MTTKDRVCLMYSIFFYKIMKQVSQSVRDKIEINTQVFERVLHKYPIYKNDISNYYLYSLIWGSLRIQIGSNLGFKLHETIFK